MTHVDMGTSLAIVMRMVLLAIPMGAAIVMTFFLYRRRFTGAYWGWLLALGAWAGAIVITVQRLKPLYSSHYYSGDRSELGVSSVVAGLLIIFAVPFVMRLYMKWVGGSITEAEKAPGSQGLRAWLGAWNLLLAVMIALCAWQGYEYNFWGVLALCVGLLLIYPGMNALTGTAQAPQPPAPPADLSDERERVLKLLEDGKVTAEEGAELLSALGQSAATPAPQSQQMTAGRKALLFGALLVIVGFFLPWYSFNLGEEMNRMTRTMSDFGGQFSQNMGGPPMQMPPGQTRFQVNSSSTLNVAGGEVVRGLGWIILVLAVIAAALPLVKLNLSRQAQRILLVAPLVAGAFIIAYLLTSDIRHVSLGLPLVLAGYVVEFLGAVKEVRSEQ